jgi:hypothetical protein
VVAHRGAKTQRPTSLDLPNLSSALTKNAPGGIGCAWYRTRFVVPHLQQRKLAFTPAISHGEGEMASPREAIFVPALVSDNALNNLEYQRVLEGLTGWQRPAWLVGWELGLGCRAVFYGV